MIQEKEITLCGHQVRMRYCAAAETGYESLSGNKIDVFLPTPIKWDDEGNPTDYIPQAAKENDYLTLCIAAIVAAYARENQEPPITGEDILYDATSKEVAELITTVAMLRAEWYNVPAVIEPDMEQDGKQGKNAQPPTTSTKK
jgi:hypothetical protein